ncbi:hypothetical protein DYE48_09920 [Halobacillus trueperi]|uniref:Uncharacterized protein n=1 Tax=Halobacillus trueperi TaxID=156205 RepID=A0A3E0J8X2_9BACI|nr:hypothetical protein DYE48_09920 [Halobacillus trueperi]
MICSAWNQYVEKHTRPDFLPLFMRTFPRPCFLALFVQNLWLKRLYNAVGERQVTVRGISRTSYGKGAEGNGETPVGSAW